MKFISSILLISVAIATIASAAPTLVRVNLANTQPATARPVDVGLVKVKLANKVQQSANLLKRCTECTPKDATALDLVVDVSAKHYSKIAHARLDNLLREIKDIKVTSGNKDLPKEKAALTIAIKSQIDKAKKDCSSEALASIIKATVISDATLDIPWSKKEEAEKKMVELGAMITRLVLDRIQANINAELLSKECTEMMTNTEIAPAPAPTELPEGSFVGDSVPPMPETPAPVPASVPAPEELPSVPETPALIPETPSITETPASIPETLAPIPETTTMEPSEDKGGPKVGIDIASNIDSKFVCKSGCKDSQDAENVLNLRVNIEKEFEPRMKQVYDKEVPADCAEKSGELLEGVLSLLAKVDDQVKM